MKKPISQSIIILFVCIGVISTFIILDRLGEKIFNIYQYSITTSLAILAIFLANTEHNNSKMLEKIDKSLKEQEQTNQLLKELILIAKNNRKNKLPSKRNRKNKI